MGVAGLAACLWASLAAPPVPVGANGAACVAGLAAPSGGSNEIVLLYTNDTGLARRLVRLDVVWPAASGRLLQTVSFGGETIWTTTAAASPVTLDSDFVVTATLRHLAAAATQSLQLAFNFDLSAASPAPYTVTAYWDDQSGGSLCASDPVEVLRGSGATGTATPTTTVTPTPTSTPTATPTPTPTRTTEPPVDPAPYRVYLPHVSRPSAAAHFHHPRVPAGAR
jgi:hypothetical protein